MIDWLVQADQALLLKIRAWVAAVNGDEICEILSSPYSYAPLLAALLVYTHHQRFRELIIRGFFLVGSFTVAAQVAIWLTPVIKRFAPFYLEYIFTGRKLPALTDAFLATGEVAYSFPDWGMAGLAAAIFFIWNDFTKHRFLAALLFIFLPAVSLSVGRIWMGDAWPLDLFTGFVLGLVAGALAWQLKEHFMEMYIKKAVREDKTVATDKENERI